MLSCPQTRSMVKQQIGRSEIFRKCIGQPHFTFLADIDDASRMRIIIIAHVDNLLRSRIPSFETTVIRANYFTFPMKLISKQPHITQHIAIGRQIDNIGIFLTIPDLRHCISTDSRHWISFMVYTCFL